MFTGLINNEMKSTPLETLTAAKFSEFLKTRFCVHIGPVDTMELELAEVTSCGTFTKGGANVPQYESFSLMFHGVQNRPLQQGSYPFEHPQMGRFDLFIVPIAQEQGMVHYQAVFNRLVKPA